MNDEYAAQEGGKYGLGSGGEVPGVGGRGDEWDKMGVGEVGRTGCAVREEAGCGGVA